MESIPSLIPRGIGAEVLEQVTHLRRALDVRSTASAPTAGRDGDGDMVDWASNVPQDSQGSFFPEKCRCAFDTRCWCWQRQRGHAPRTKKSCAINSAETTRPRSPSSTR